MTDRKPVFDAVRIMLGRPFEGAEVNALDRALDEMLGVIVVRPQAAVNEAGLALIKQFEGCKLKAYPDPGSGGDPITIGWGTTRIDGRAVRRGETITQARADELLAEQVAEFAVGVAKLVSDKTNDRQFGALLSFAYNVGLNALKTSTLLRKHNDGDYAGAAAQFPRWNKAGGRVMAGLTRRREAEARLYRS